MMRPAEKCRDLLTVVAAKCRRKLGIFQFLCKIVDIAKNVCSVAEGKLCPEITKVIL